MRPTASCGRCTLRCRSPRPAVRTCRSLRPSCRRCYSPAGCRPGRCACSSVPPPPWQARQRHCATWASRNRRPCRPRRSRAPRGDADGRPRPRSRRRHPCGQAASDSRGSLGYRPRTPPVPPSGAWCRGRRCRRTRRLKPVVRTCSKSHPRMPVPIETNRILRPAAPVPCAESVGGSSTVALTAAPAATAPAPRRTKSLRVILMFILPLSPCSAILALQGAGCKESRA